MSAAVIAVAGIYLLIVLLNSMRPVFSSGFFIIPGQFLYFSFMGAAFYLPLLFLISSVLLLADYYNVRIFAAKLFSLVPFFTFSLLLRVLNYIPGSPAADFIINNIGLRGGSAVLGILLIPEVLIFVRILSGKSAGRVTLSSTVEPETSVIEKTEEESVFTPVPMEWSGNSLPASEGEPDELESLEAVDEPVTEPGDSEAEPDTEPDEIDIEEPDVAEGEAEAEATAEEEPEDDSEIVFEEEPEDSPLDLELIENDPEIQELPIDDNEDDELIDDDIEESIVEPLDLDPDAGLPDDEDDEAAASADEEEDTAPVIVPVHHEDENYPDAPVRGDEEDISRTAKEVWADAEQLGFTDLMPENLREEQVSVTADDKPEEADEAEDIEEIEEIEELGDPDEDGIRLDIEDGQSRLEIPEIKQAEPDETDEVEELEDVEGEIEPVDAAVDIDPFLSSHDEPVQEEPVPPAPKKKKSLKYVVPVEELLQHYGDDKYWVVDDETKEAAEILRETLEEFRIAAEVTGISRGPVVTMFEILPAPGVKLSKIVNLADNIALRLAASRVRIVAPIPGKHAVGIEVPNKNRSIVSFKEILEDEDLKKSRMAIPVVLGKDITGGSRIIDLVQTPHLLIAGATGSGKSVSVNSLICSILYSRTPDEVKMILVDPKIVELKLYNDIPHLLTPVITEPKRAFQALQYAMCEMERRYSLLNALGVRDIKAYNRKVREARMTTDKLPYIVIIVDEFADLMATTGKELENVISRLAAMSRAVGIHLVLATQRPSVDVITGLIKANIPSRIAFMVASKTDSRIILDSMGADKLLGKGDMLFTSAWDPNPVRIQGAFLSDDEVERVTDHVKTLGEPDYIDDEIFVSDDEGGEFELESSGGGDPLMDAAVQIVVEAGKASASYLQRRLKIGYNRAARLVEDMEDRGIVGPANGSKPREIIHIPDRV